MKLSVTARLLDQDPRRADQLILEMSSDVEAAMVELRALAHGIAPPLLVERGLGAALTEVAQRAALPTTIRAEDVGRCDPAVERAIYFCCLEALQNAAKHSGPGASAHVTLIREDQVLRFCVENDGVSQTSTMPSADGQGLTNMRQRIESVGGQIETQSRSDQGFRVIGTVIAPQLEGAPAAAAGMTGLKSMIESSKTLR